MKHFSFLSPARMSGLLLSVLAATFASQAQQSVPYLVGTGKHLEFVGFPVHLPAVDSGPVTSVSGTLVSWTPSFRDRPFGSALPRGQECYAEVVGPIGHPWLGHRFELDEAVTLTRTDHGLAVASSPFNTRGLINTSLVGAQLEVRPHLTVDGLWGEILRNRIIHGKEVASTFVFSVPAFPATRELSPWLQDGLLGWNLFNRPATTINGPLLIPPGAAVGVDFGEIRGSALGITGVQRDWPTASPLRAGVNLLAYPYAKDLRLGIDWGRIQDGFVGLPRPNGNQDRIEIVDGTGRLIYTPESQANGGIRWRQMQTNSGRVWVNPPKYLDVIPVGQGFVLWKTKADPNHFFNPPRP